MGVGGGGIGDGDFDALSLGSERLIDYYMFELKLRISSIGELLTKWEKFRLVWLEQEFAMLYSWVWRHRSYEFCFRNRDSLVGVLAKISPSLCPLIINCLAFVSVLLSVDKPADISSWYFLVVDNVFESITEKLLCLQNGLESESIAPSLNNLLGVAISMEIFPVGIHPSAPLSPLLCHIKLKKTKTFPHTHQSLTACDCPPCPQPSVYSTPSASYS